MIYSVPGPQKYAKEWPVGLAQRFVPAIILHIFGVEVEVFWVSDPGVPTDIMQATKAT